MPGSAEVTNLLRDRINTVADSAQETRDLLTTHVTECAAMQRKVLLLSACILTWMVAHSTEAGKLATLILETAKAVGLL